MKQESAQNGWKDEGDNQVVEEEMKREHGHVGNGDKLGANRQCPHLDIIYRGVLDFDFDKLCSMSLSMINCYTCLVYGKYFQVGESPVQDYI